MQYMNIATGWRSTDRYFNHLTDSPPAGSLAFHLLLSCLSPSPALPACQSLPSGLGWPETIEGGERERKRDVNMKAVRKRRDGYGKGKESTQSSL